MAFDLKTAIPAKEIDVEGEKYVIPTKPFNLKNAVPIGEEPTEGERTFDLALDEAQIIAKGETQEALEVDYGYGNRTDGTPKGTGFLGELQRPDGKVSTELSIGVVFDGKEMEIPTLIPTLEEEEVKYLLDGGKSTPEIVQKAIEHAKSRMGTGKNPFATSEETKFDWDKYGEYRAVPKGEWNLTPTPEEVRRNKGRASVQMAYKDAGREVPRSIKARWWLDDKQIYTEKGLELGVLALGGWPWVLAKTTYDVVKNTFVGYAKGEKPSLRGALRDRNIRESGKIQEIVNSPDFTQAARLGVKIASDLALGRVNTPLNDFINKEIDKLSGQQIFAAFEEIVDMAIPILIAGVVGVVAKGEGEVVKAKEQELIRADLRPKITEIMTKKGETDPQEIEKGLESFIAGVYTRQMWNPEYLAAIRKQTTKQFWKEFIKGKLTDKSGKALIPEFNLPPDEIKKIAGKATSSSTTRELVKFVLDASGKPLTLGLDDKEALSSEDTAIYLREIKKDIADGEAGYRHRTPDGEWIPIASTYPDWFRNKGYSQELADTAFKNLESGRTLTDKQQKFMNDVVQAVQGKVQRDADFAAEEKAQVAEEAETSFDFGANVSGSGEKSKTKSPIQQVKTPSASKLEATRMQDRADFEVAQQKLVDEMALGRTSTVEKRKLQEKLDKLRSDYKEKLATQKDTQKVKQKELTARQKRSEAKKLEAEKKKRAVEVAKRKKEVASEKAKAKFEVALQKAADEINFAKKGAKVKQKIADRAEVEKIKEKRKALTARANKLRNTKLVGDYNERVDAILDQYDLGNRTTGTKTSREKRQKYFESLTDLVDMSVLGKDFFKGLGTTTLDEMTLLELERLEAQIEAIVHAAKTKDKLMKRKELKEEAEVVEDILNTIESRAGYKVDPSGEKGIRVTDVEKAKMFGRIRKTMSNFFASITKAEFVADMLNIAEHITDPLIVDSADASRRLMNEMETRAQELFKPAKKLIKKWNKKVHVEGVRKDLTTQQLIGVALNSGDADNIRSLIEGNAFTPNEVKIIRDYVMGKPEMARLVEGLWKILEDIRPHVAAAFEKKTGVKFRPVDGMYFPKMYDTKLSDLIKINSNLVDMYAATVHSADVRFGSTIERTDAKGALNLNFMEPLYFNIMRAIKYATYTNNVDYVNKVLHNPAVKDAIIGSMNEETYAAVEEWLRRVANPFVVQKSQMEGFINYIRYSTSQFFLGANTAVSGVQALSFFDTIDEIGLLHAIEGVGRMYGNILVGNNLHGYVMDSSSMMKDRYSHGKFNRELSDTINGGALDHLIKGKKDLKQLYYMGITVIDYLTTMPTWLGAEKKGLKMFNGDEKAAREYADKVVRKTQPDASIENMAIMMSGNAFQKLFTVFMSYTSTHHNRLVKTSYDLFKNKELTGPKKVRDAVVSFWWLALPGGLLAGYIKKSLKKKEPGARKPKKEVAAEEKREKMLSVAKGVTGGMPFVRDAMQGVMSERADMDVSAFSFIEYAIGAATKDDKVKDLVYLFGLFSKLYPKSTADWFLNKYDNKVEKRPH